jgi:integrase
MRNFAGWLANALEWAEARDVDLMTADYSADLIARYQEEMLKGIWSAHNKPLSPETVNARVQIALEFQLWAADKGLRESFIIPTTTNTYVAGSHANSRSHEVKTAQSRKGKAKVNKRTLSFPSLEEIEAWRRRVYERQVVGATEGLIADLILNTAIRRQEAACWRVDTLPIDAEEWKVVNPDQPEDHQSVLVTLKHCTKGKEYGIDEHGDKIGPEGTIHIPLWVARRIHEYRNKERLLALKRKLNKGKTVEAQRRLQQQTVHLFLHPDTGERYTGDQIYAFWSRVQGPAHWSPHMGRDWWACRYLEERMKQHTDLIRQALKMPNASMEHPMVLAMRDTAQTVIQLEIRPQLRHASVRTTEIYLQWLFAKLHVPLSMTRQWIELDEEKDKEDDEE